MVFLGLEQSTAPAKGPEGPPLLLRFVAPAVPRGALDRPVAAFTCSTFLPGTAAALSATEDGSVLLWDAPPAAVLEGRELDKAAVKAVRLAEAPEDDEGTVINKGGEEEGEGSAITWMDTVALPQQEQGGGLLDATGKLSLDGTAKGGEQGGGGAGSGGPVERVVVVGTADGVIRVFDTALRLLAWAEDLDAGPITSVSFEAMDGEEAGLGRAEGAGGGETGAASLPPFIVSTSRALVLAVDPAAAFGALDADARRGQLILQGHEDAVTAVECSPSEDQRMQRVLVGTRGGSLYLWDARARALLLVRLLQEEAEEAEAERLAALHAPRTDGLQWHEDEFAVTAASWHPSSAVLAVAIGGAEGAARHTSVRILDAATLGDAQAPLGGSTRMRRTEAAAAAAASVGRGSAASGASGPGKHGAVPLDGPQGVVTHLAFSPEGRWLAAADDQGYLCLWHFARTRAGASAQAAATLAWKQGVPGQRGGEGEGKEEGGPGDDRWVLVGRMMPHGRRGRVTGMAWSPGQATRRSGLVDQEGKLGEGGGRDPFGEDEDDDDATVPQPRLCVVGTDRRAVEIDVGASSLAVGLKHRPERPRLEQSATPTACAWIRADGRADVRAAPGASAATAKATGSGSGGGAGGELQLLVASDAHKIRLWGASPLSSRSCRRTVRAPLFGGAPSRLVPVPARASAVGGLGGGSSAAAAAAGGSEDEPGAGQDGAGDVSAGSPSSLDISERLMVFAAPNRVAGLLVLPTDGDPRGAAGVVAHPGEISGVAVSGDGSRMVSAGGEDGAAMVWRIDPDAMQRACMAPLQATPGALAEGAEAALPEGVEETDPFVAQLPGGRAGQYYQDVCDFFAHAQIRAHGEESARPRAAGVRLPASELPSLLRALGCYLSEREAAAAVDEVRGGPQLQGGDDKGSGDGAGFVELPVAVRLLVNHRPVRGAGVDGIREALAVVARKHGSTGVGEVPTWQVLRRALLRSGEAMGEVELEACMEALTGRPDGGLREMDDVDEEAWTHQVLGFVDSGAGGT